MKAVSVCIATFRRPASLALLLQDLLHQSHAPAQVVVVDNDFARSARPVVSAAQAQWPEGTLVYAVQPQQNISLARNRSIALAQAPWIAMIDDDERAPPDWLERLCDASERFGADGVLGPVLPMLPDDCAPWLRRGRFYDWARFASGTPVPLNRLRLGNALIRGRLLRALPQAFDPQYGRTGGEDGDLLARLVQQGARLVWCDEACVSEPVESRRQTLRWLLRRALRGGQDFARHTLAGRYGTPSAARRIALYSRASMQLCAALLLSAASLPLGRHHSAKWLVAACANLGKLSQAFGWHYREYT